MGKNYGYVRVSSKDQNVARQMAALQKTHLPFTKVYTDQQSGKDFERAGYKGMMRVLKEGDLLVIKSIDRLGRNYDEIIEQWRIITKEKKADILVLDMPLLDTRNKSGDLTQSFIADLVLQILSYVAQNEREFIKARQAEGIAAAKERGVRFGRKAIVPDNAFYDAVERHQIGEISLRQAAKLANMPYSTFQRKYTGYMQKKLV